MADMNARDQRIATLQTWFHTSSEDGPVDEDGIQAFLDEVANVHFTPIVAADGRAAAIHAAGYSSVHDIAGITNSELQQMGFVQGNAKRVSSYLGSRPRDASPNRLLPAGPLSVVASQQHSAQIGAAVAMAVTTAQTKIKLNDGSTSNPTVSCVIKWANKHLEKSNISGYGAVTTVLQLLIDDMSMDLTPHLTAEPAISDDASYAREVFASLTPDQIQKFGGGEKASALTLIQNVMKYVADMKMTVYVSHATSFNAVSATVDPTAVRGRFNNFTSLLNEVRFHKMFELKDAIKKIVAIVAPDVFLVNEVLAMWNLSAKDQKSLTAVIKYVKDEVDVPGATDGTPKKKDKSGYSGKGGGKGRQSGYQGSGNYGKGNQSSGNSYSNNKQGQRQNTGQSNRKWEPSRPAYNQSRTNTNQTATVAQVNHIRESAVAEAREQWDREQYDKDREERLESLQAQVDNMATAQLIAQFSGDVESNGHIPRIASVFQAKTRSGRFLEATRTRAPTELERLRRAHKVASISSVCKLSKAPLIDSATDTDVIGTDSVKHATNVQTCKPFEFETISGGGVSNKRGDLVTPLLTMESAPIVDTARTSIVSTDTIHRKGFTIVSDVTGMSLHKDGVAYEAVPDGVMHRLPVADEGKTDASINLSVALHRKTVLDRVLRKMIQHRKRGHRPADPEDCDGCALNLVRKKANRLKPDAQRHSESRGLIAGVDYITGLPVDNDGNTAVLGVVIASREKGQSVAWYHPVKSHSGDDAIAAFKECEFRLSLMFPPGEFKLARVHSDCEKSLIGPLCELLKARGIWPTNTEGYDHNGNAVVEARNRVLLKGLRCALSTAAGRARYTEVWGAGVVHITDCINHTSHAGEPSPVQNCGGEPVDLESESLGVFGCLVKFYRPIERRDGKLDTTAAFGAYAGRSHDVPGGHRVIELVWNHGSKRFDLMPTIDVKTCSFDVTKYPLRSLPAAGSKASSFDDFIDMFDPKSEKLDVYEVYRLIDHRFVSIPGSRLKSLEYKVHWKGCLKKDSTWEPESNLTHSGAAKLVLTYRKVHVPKIYHVTSLDHDYLATHEIMQRHKLDIPFDKCLKAYKLEFNTVCDLRMVELHGEERERVLKEEKAPRLRMNPEPKPDDRLKMRLLVMGHLEPHEWTSNMSLDSPTPAASSVKMMVAMSDETAQIEELSVGDVATAFLKGDEYSSSDRPRYVTYRQYRGSRLRVFRLKGSLYGQRDAPVRWFKTFRDWLVNEKGFDQCKNDVCLFRNPVTGVKLLLWVDDNLMRGVKHHTDKLWAEIDAKFGLKHHEYLECGVSRTFIGVSLLKSKLNGQTVYCMDQNAEVRAFLSDTPVMGAPLKSPMRDRNDLYVNDTPASKQEATWFRSKLMSCSYYACWTRLDIACTVNRLAQKLSAPSVSALDELKRLLRYMNGRPDFTLVATRPQTPSTDEWKFYVDSDLAGEAPRDTTSRTGSISLLNKMPVHWMSKKQPKTAFSSAASEVFAFSEAVKDARLLLWRAEELGVNVKYPFTMLEDNAATVSYQKSTTPYSKLRGVYNLRDNWVLELKDSNVVKAEKVHTDLNVADLFTKCHEWHKMKKLLSLIGLDKEPNLEFRGCLGTHSPTCT